MRNRPPVAVGLVLLVASGLVAVAVAMAMAVSDDRPAADRLTLAGVPPQAASQANGYGRASASPATALPMSPSAPANRSTAKSPPKRAAAKPSPAKTARKPTRPAPKPAPVRAKPAWVSPMPGVPLSSCYGPRWGTVHQGIDLAGPSGTPIRAVGAGTVTAAGWTYRGYGISVVIDHRNGYLTHYAHASRVLVRVGQRVKPGQYVAIEGSTGDSTGPHLHFEVHHGMWHQIDPAPWLRFRGVRIGC